MEKRIKFFMQLPSDILLIQSEFKAAGFKLFLVGGAVRDAYLGMKPKDFDLATDALPDEVENLMKGLAMRTLGTGKAFGVINVFTLENEYEVATFREDIGSGRRPDSVKFTTIEGDVKRRDLTINALFFDLETNEIVDLVGGLDDLSQGIIRTVGSAEDRFGEDRLRILRAIRFAARFGSKLDDDIIDALKKDPSLEGISSERIRDEFLKGIKTAKSVRNFIQMLVRYKLMGQIFLPDLYINTNVGFTKDPILVLAQLLHMNRPEVLKQHLNKLSYTTDEIRDIVFLTNLIVTFGRKVIELKKEQKHTKLNDAQIAEFARLTGLEGVFIDVFLEFELSVTGAKVMEETGMKAGPDLGILINEMELNNFRKLFRGLE
jgi:tRNA nucleotidyltransferase/poly(A) polymerase